MSEKELKMLPAEAQQEVADRKTAGWVAYIALAGLGCFVLTVVLLHWIQPNLDPLQEAVSYYIHGDQGWLLTVGLLGLGLGSIALTIGIARAVDGPGARTGRWLLAVWSFGVLLGGIFRADPPGNWDQPPSIAGMIHGNAAMLAFLALPIASLMLVKSFQFDSRWRRKATLLLILAIAAVLSLGVFMASLVPVFVSPGPPILLGLTERVLLGTYVVWLGVVAYGLVQVGGRQRITK